MPEQLIKTLGSYGTEDLCSLQTYHRCIAGQSRKDMESSPIFNIV